VTSRASDPAVASSIRVPAPAKLNLFLHVTGRRADGYHLLESLMVPLDYGDTITLTSREDGAVVRGSAVAGVAADDDLAVRAARALKRSTNCDRGVTIDIAKRIPIGAGLGGGSSDAASTLIGLDRLWRLGLARSRLMEIGATLGADVPFFVHGHAAIARGVGEVLAPVTMPARWAAVITPAVIVPTAEIFAALALTRFEASAKMNVFSEGYGRNSLESVACSRHPQVADALRALRRRDAEARMTGSGGSVFALFGAEDDADGACASALAQLRGARGFVARTLASHPLAA